MEEMRKEDQEDLIRAIALREGTAKQLSRRYKLSIEDLKAFVEANKPALEKVREVALSREGRELTQEELDSLWITNKHERLKRYQHIAELLYEDIQSGRDSTALREFRSYLMAVANELGQLLHRGQGDAGMDSLAVEIQGVNIDNLR